MTSNIIKQPLELEELPIDLDMPDDRPESTPENNCQLTLVQKKLRRLTSDLDFIVKHTGKNKSLISKTAELFSNLPTLGKIAIGLALTLPILITGLVLHIGILLLISGVIALTCVLTGLLLEEHHRLNIGIPTEIKNYLTNIHSLMTETIEELVQATAALNQIRQELSEEIKRLENENNALHDNIHLFQDKITSLQEKIDSLTETNTKMNDTSKRFTRTLELFMSSTFESNSNQKEALERLEKYIYQGEAFIDDANKQQEKLTKIGEKLIVVTDTLCQLQTRQEKNIDHLIGHLKTTSATSSHLDLASSSRFYKPASNINKPESNAIAPIHATIASSSKVI